MQGSNVLGLIIVCLFPLILLAQNSTNNDERIELLCNSDGFEEFPVEELGECTKYGENIAMYVNLISLVWIGGAIMIFYYYDKTHPYTIPIKTAV